MSIKSDIIAKCEKVYEKGGQSAVYTLVNKFNKGKAEFMQIPWEHCNGCDCESPAFVHECLVCGQTTK